MANSKPENQGHTRQQRLEDALKKQIGYYKRGAIANSKYASVCRISLILLAAAITVAVGIQWHGKETELKNVALVLSACATGLASFEAFRDYRGRWLRSQETYLWLINLRARYQFLMAESTESEKVVAMHWKELQDFLGSTHTSRIEGLADAIKTNAELPK